MKRQLRNSVLNSVAATAVAETHTPLNIPACDMRSETQLVGSSEPDRSRTSAIGETVNEIETEHGTSEPNCKSSRLDHTSPGDGPVKVIEDSQKPDVKSPTLPDVGNVADATVETLSQTSGATHVTEPSIVSDRASAVLDIERAMCSQIPRADFVSGKVTHVYNPLEHAASPHSDYVRRCLHHGGPVPFLLVGMNPGPWGMSQTGVPFGEIPAVRDWMGVRGEVVPPAGQNPNRLVEGFNCAKSEVSGRRFWGLWQRLSGSPSHLFRRVFVHNLCPLAFMESSGKNVTPNCLSRPLRDRLEPVCRTALVQIVQMLGAHTVVGIGKYAEDQARRALKEAGLADRVRVFPLLHPSPINPQANKNWDEVAIRQLTAAGVLPLP